jgi:hypothetical protein
MSLDRYSSCPGGTGKKIKFCCSDMVSELDKVQRMLQGRQYASCLELINQLEARKGDRACLLACKLSLQQGLKDEEGAGGTLRRFVTRHPDNAIALGELAVDQVNRGELSAGLHNLQRAVGTAGSELPHQVFTAMGRMAEQFLHAGHMLPARGLLLLQASINRADTAHAREMLARLTASPAVPLLFKDSIPFDAAPADVAWSGDFNSALALALRAQWQRAADLWSAVSSSAGDSPIVWKNLAVVRGYTGDYSGAAYAYRRYAELTPSEQDAVEAEATAQLLTKNTAEGLADDLVVTYDVRDFEALQARLSADPRSEQTEIDAQDFEGETPPQVIYALLDRTPLTDATSLSREAIPQVLAEALLFAADGDEPPRLELEVFRPQYATAEALLRELAGEALGNKENEEVVDRMSAVELALSWRWRLPDDTPEATRRRLLFEQRRHMVLDVWPQIAMPLFQGRTPSEAAKDPAMKTRLAAAVLLLELEDTDPAADEICDELRKRLELPVPPAISPDGVDLSTLRLARFARLQIDKLSDVQLSQALSRAAAAQYETAMRRLSQEVVRRESTAPELQLAAYQYLARFEEETEKAEEHMAQARKLAARLKRQTSPRDMELSARIAGRYTGRAPARRR